MEGIEELKKRYRTISNEIEKADALFILIRESIQQFPENTESNKAYLSELKGLVSRNKPQKGLAHVHFCEGLLFSEEYSEKALNEYLAALNIYRELHEYHGVAQVLMKMGAIFFNIKQCDKAEEYYNEALKVARRVNDELTLGRALVNLGLVLVEKKQQNEALACFTESIKITQQSGDKFALKRAYSNLVIMYGSFKQYDKAKEACLNALKILRKDQDQRFYGRMLNNIAIIYTSTQEYDKALRYFNKSIRIKNEIDDKTYASSILNAGVVYLHLKRYNKALVFYKKALKLALQVKDTITASYCYAEMAACYALLKDFKNAFNSQLNVEKFREQSGNIKDAPIYIAAHKGLKETAKEFESIQIEKDSDPEKDVYKQLFEKSRVEKLPEGLQDLSKREMETLSVIRLGMTDKQIAEKLFVSVATTKTHLRSIFVKLSVKSRAELITLIHRFRLFDKQ